MKMRTVAILTASVVTLMGCARTSTRTSDPSSPTRSPSDPAAPAQPDLAVDIKSLDGRIAFSGGEPADIYVVNADGTQLKRLTHSPEMEFDPSWSPDGTKIAYRSHAGGGNSEIYVMDADGSHKTNVTKNPAEDLAPAWSPDGRLIAFSRYRASTADIWLMRPDGSGAHRIPGIEGEYVTWSPDGTQIAFDHLTYTETGFDIWVADIDGENAHPVVDEVGDDQGPAWSPDGASLAFGSEREATASYDHVWLANADGSNQTRLSQDYVERPDWSPDGEHIAVTGGRLFVMNGDGTGVTPLPIKGVGEIALIDWGP